MNFKITTYFEHFLLTNLPKKISSFSTGVRKKILFFKSGWEGVPPSRFVSLRQNMSKCYFAHNPYQHDALTAVPLQSIFLNNSSVRILSLFTFTRSKSAFFSVRG